MRTIRAYLLILLCILTPLCVALNASFKTSGVKLSPLPETTEMLRKFDATTKKEKS